MFLKGESTIQGYPKVDRVGTVLKWCSRPFDDKWCRLGSLQGLHVGGCARNRGIAHLGLW